MQNDNKDLSFLQNAVGDTNVSRETFAQLKEFSEQLLKWNARINLVSKKITQEELWRRHIVDSAQLLKYIPYANTKKIVDLGSGAGFPGLILSIVSGCDVVAVESDQRKCAFMQEIVGKFKLNVRVLNSRIEDVAELNCDLITSRALASLTKLMEYSENILQEESFMLFLKGQNAAEEIKEASSSWSFHDELFDSVCGDGMVLKIANLRRL